MSRTMKFLVTSIKPEGKFIKFFALKDEAVEEILRLERAIQERFRAGMFTPVSGHYDLVTGAVYIVNSRIRQHWCRARVGPVGVHQVNVTLIDYGDLEVVPIGDVRMCDQQIAHIRPLVRECILADVIPSHGAAQWSEDAVSICRRYLVGQTLSGNVVTEFDKIPVVRLAQMGATQPFVQKLVNEGLAEIYQYQKTENQVYSGPKFKQLPLEVGTTHLVTISCIEATHRFYIQLSPAENELKNLMESIEICAAHEKFLPLGKPVVGMPCLATASGNTKQTSRQNGNVWHCRAVVNDIAQNMCKIMLVDYGETVAKDFHELWALPPQFLSLPAQAIKCSLRDPAIINLETFRRLVQKHKYFTCQVVAALNDTYVVLLSYNNRDLQSLAQGDSNASYSTLPLPLRATVEVSISYIQDPCHFYCQAVGHKNILNSITSLLEPGDDFNPLNEQELAVGAPVCAKFSVDGLWYRSTIVSISNPDNIEVLFVDFGNGEKVGLSDLRAITPDLLKYPLMAYKCCLHDVSPTDDVRSDAIAEWFEDVIAEKTVKAEIMGCSQQNIYSVILYVDGESQSFNKMLLKKLSTPIGSYPPVLQTEKVYVTHTSTESFFGQLSKFKQEELISLQESLNQFYASKTPENIIPSVGDLVCAKFSGDDQYYRAVVESVSNSTCGVYFVDYGNREQVSSTDVHQIHQKFCAHPYFGVEFVLKMSLGSVPASRVNNAILESEIELKMISEIKPGMWSATLTESYPGNAVVWNIIKMANPIGPRSLNTSSSKSLATDSDGNSHVGIGSTEPVWLTSLKKRTSPNSEQSMASTESDVVEDYDQVVMPRESLKEVFVSYVKNPSEFYCQITVESLKLLEMMESIREMYGKLKPSEMSIVKVRDGMPCCAMSEEDGTWYRAKIVKSMGSSYEVFYVDYGNNETLDAARVKVLHKKFLSLSPQALRCGLFNIVPAGGCWSEKDIRAFSEMTCKKSFVAQFVKATSNGTFLVNLLPINRLQEDVLNKAFAKLGHGHLEDSSKVLVVNSLVASTSLEFVEPKVKLGSTEDVIVTFISVSLRVFCQIKSRLSAFHKMMEEIQNYYNSSAAKRCIVDRPAVGMICIAQFSLDQEWYRAKVLEVERSSVTVLYVDYGNQETIPKNNIKYILQEYVALPIQAIECAMQDLVSIGEVTLSDSMGVLFEGDVQCSFISSKENYYVVNLTKGDKNIASELLKILGLGVSETGPDSDSSPFEIPPYNISFQKGHLLTVSVSFIESPAKFWCQVADSADQLDELMDSIESYCSTETYQGNLKVGSSCIAKYSQDGAWYRACIKGDKGTNEKEVFFVDYGNVDTVDQTEIRKIKEEFVSLPAQAIQCCLHNVPRDVSEEACSKFRELVENVEEVTAKVEGVRNNVVYVTLLVESEPDVEINVLEAVFGDAAESSTDEMGDFPPVQVPVGEHSITIAYSVNPDNFHIHLVAQSQELEELSDHLQVVYEELESPIQNIVPGMPCCAKFSEDGVWYRAQVSDVAGDSVTVYFVDYGNYDVVEKSSMKLLNAEDMQKPPFAIPSCLANVSPVTGKWNDEAVNILSDLIEEECLSACFQQQSIPAPVVIKKGDKNIQDELVDKGLAKLVSSEVQPKDVISIPSAEIPDDKPIESASYKKAMFKTTKFTAKVSHVESHERFFITAVEWEDDLYALSDALNEACSAKDNDTDVILEVGRPCAAKYSEDESWYRAVITHVDGSEVSVLFVDYGNRDTVSPSDIRNLKAEFFAKPPFAVTCAIAGLKAIDGKESEVTTKLQELVDEDVSLQVDVIGGESPVLVKLGDFLDRLVEEGLAMCFDDLQTHSESLPSEQPPPASDTQTGEPVSFKERLLGTGSFSAKISHVESHEEFFVTAVEWTDDLIALSDALNEACTADSVENEVSWKLGLPCAAKYSEDDLWYRATITQANDTCVSVLFVDYGNGDTVSVSDLKELRKEFLVQPPFAVKCKMGNLVIIEGKESDVTTKLQKLVDEEVSLETQVIASTSPVSVIFPDFFDELVREELVLHMTTQETTQDPSFAAAVVEPLGEDPLASFPERKLQCGAKLTVSLTHVVSCKSFYMMMSDCAEEYEVLKSSLDEFCEADQSGVELNSLYVGFPCAAKYSADGTWYRASVIRICEEEITVLFVDHGNEETVELKNVKKLGSDFFKCAPFAVECTLFDLKPCDEEKVFAWLNDKLEAVSDFEIEIFNGKKPYAVKIFALCDNLIDNDVVQVSDAQDSGAVEETGTQDPDTVEETGIQDPDTVEETGTQDPDAVQETGTQDPDAVQETDTQDHGAVQETDTQDPEACQVADAQDSEAVQVTYTQDSEAVQQSDTQDLDAEAFCTQDEDSDQLKFTMGEKCEETNFEVTDKHSEVCEQKQVVNDSNEANGSVAAVAPSCDGDAQKEGDTKSDKSGSQLLPPGSNIYPKRELKTSFSGRISSVHSWNKLFVAASLWSDDEATVRNELQKVEVSSALQMSEVSPGSACIVKIGGGAPSWHRAVVEIVEGNSISVLLIDSGNSVKVDKSALWKANPELLAVPPLAVECYLSGLSELGLSNEEEHQIYSRLQSYCESGTSVDVNVVSNNLPYGVRIIRDGTDVLKASTFPSSEAEHFQDPEVFKGNLKIAFVEENPSLEYSLPSQTVGLDEIIGDLKHVQANQVLLLYIVPSELEDSLAQQQVDIQNMYNELAATTPVIKERMYCAAKFPEDSAWYRAIILQCSDNSVLVKSIDYGSEEEIARSDIRELHQTFTEKPPFAVECSHPGIRILEGCEEAVQNRLMQFESEYAVKLCKYPQHSSKDRKCIESILVSDADIVQILLEDQLVKQVYPEYLDFSEFECMPEELIFEDSSCFYLFPMHLCGERNMFQELLQIDYCDSMHEDFLVSTNCLYAALIDSNWYRVSVKEVFETSALVVCVDYGTIHGIPFTDMRILAPEFCHESPFSLRCCIPGIIFTGHPIQQRLAQLLQGKLLKCLIIGHDAESDAHKVLMSVNGIDVYTLFTAQINSPDSEQEFDSPSTASSNISQISENFESTCAQQPASCSNLVGLEKAANAVDLCGPNEKSDELEPVNVEHSKEDDTEVDQDTGENSIASMECTDDSPEEPKHGHEVHQLKDDSSQNENIETSESSLPIEGTMTDPEEHEADISNAATDSDEISDETSCREEEIKLAYYSNVFEKKTQKVLKREDMVIVTNISVDRYSYVVCFVVPTDCRQELDVFQAKIQDYYKSEPEEAKSSTCRVSELCVAKSGDMWKRGLVLSVNEEEARILFIDYGREERVNINNVKELSEEFGTAPFAFFCCLPRLKYFDPKAEEKLCANLLDKEVPIDILSPGCPYQVKLLDDANIVQQLISENLLVLQLSSHCVSLKRHLVKISYVNCDPKSGLSVHLRLVEQLDDLATFVNRMQCVYQNKIGIFTVDEAVDTGLYAVEHNGVWKRCTVLKADEKVLLYLVDEGDCLDTDGVLLEPLLFDFSLQPPFAAPCSIDNLPPEFDESLAADVLQDAAKSGMELWATFHAKKCDGFYSVFLTGKDEMAEDNEKQFWQLK